ncbi:tRNA wybutosine-synthesizing protein 4 [Trichoplax sp. H2]|nr:tRNA wybutosine-synthesizing protein 4 [Trichoplax sp. H2]|eukprot:RDD38765.1 tRNA wybutosine-synthesizing protein 4 [Trichoplax sp. H2]
MKKTKKSRSDTAVQGTNDNSIVSKLSSAKHGYYQDDFLQYVVQKPARRSPLINRGYYIRAKAIDFVIRKFLSYSNNDEAANKNKQILSLGAGFDTLYYRYHSLNMLDSTIVYEVDFPELVKNKSRLIRNNDILKNAIGNEISNTSNNDTGISTQGYKLIGSDLKNLPVLEKNLLFHGIDSQSPTLILSECVLTYINPSSSSSIIGWASKFFSNAMFVTYEQIQPNDAFGRVMRNHFKQIGSPLKCIDSYPTKIAQIRRYESLRWSDSVILDMNDFYYKILPEQERQRIEHLELFDEFEEWHLKCSHYILICAFVGSLQCQAILGEFKRYQSLDGSQRIKPDIYSNCNFLDVNGTKNLRRFGHKICLLNFNLSPSDNSMFIAVTGGFGLLSDSRHRRLSDISVFHITNDPKKEITLVNSTELDNPRLFHAVIPISDNKIAIFGGRLSPLKHYGDVIVVTFNLEPIHTDESTTEGDLAKTPTSSQLKHKVDIGWESIACSGDMPTARWRHTATIIDDGKCLIFGGITTNMVTLNDSYIFEFASRKWSRVSVAGLVSPRHSHTACKWKDYVVVYGGLGFDFKPAIGISALNIKDELAMNWISLEFNPQLPTRYSHTAHVLEDRLLVIGGIDPFLTCTNTLIDINLENRTWRMFLLQEPCIEKPILMLHNHDSVCLGKSRQQVFTLGGGGNCFSFGTHFNSHLLEIVLPT